MNHSANNRQQLKATQVRNQLKREEEEAKAAEAPFKMARFRGVESVLRQKSAEGTLGQGISRGGDGSASDSRRTGGVTSKMAGLSVRGPASVQRGTQRGAGAKAATVGAAPQRQQFDDEEDESIYAQGGGGGGQGRGAPHQQREQHEQYDDEDGGGDFSPREYEDGGRFDDEAEQEYTRQQLQQGHQQQGRGRPQYDDADDEDIHALATQGPRGQHAAAAAAPARGGIASMRIPAGLQAQQNGGGGGGASHDGRSFIAANARKVIQTSKALASARSNQSDERGAGTEPLGQFLSSHPASAPAPTASIAKHDNYGKVPAYIRAQQSDMAAAKARAAEEAKEKELGIPPGMILMPEDQRLHTLAVLQENHKKVLYDISCFPLRIETISRKKARAELEEKLLEIEKALQLFSRKRVLIQP